MTYYVLYLGGSYIVDTINANSKDEAYEIMCEKYFPDEYYVVSEFEYSNAFCEWEENDYDDYGYNPYIGSYDYDC